MVMKIAMSKKRGCWPAVARYLQSIDRPVTVETIISEATTIRYKNGRVYEGRPIYKTQKCPTPRQLQQLLKADKNVERIGEEGKKGMWRWRHED